jgi:hypothetical protein
VNLKGWRGTAKADMAAASSCLPTSVMNSRSFIRSPRRRGRAGSAGFRCPVPLRS